MQNWKMKWLLLSLIFIIPFIFPLNLTVTNMNYNFNVEHGTSGKFIEFNLSAQDTINNLTFQVQQLPFETTVSSLSLSQLSSSECEYSYVHFAWKLFWPIICFFKQL